MSGHSSLLKQNKPGKMETRDWVRHKILDQCKIHIPVQWTQFLVSIPDVQSKQCLCFQPKSVYHVYQVYTRWFQVVHGRSLSQLVYPLGNCGATAVWSYKYASDSVLAGLCYSASGKIMSKTAAWLCSAGSNSTQCYKQCGAEYITKRRG